MIRPSLTELANRHGSDKGTLGPSAGWSGNNYTDVYEGFFQPLRDRPIHVLEIGLGVRGENWEAAIAHGRNAEGGGSIKALHDYFPKAQILGVDINPASHLERERLRTFVVDQGDRAAWRRFLEEAGSDRFDIIIDDGSHRPDHQQTTLDMLFAHLAPGGLYIIEDLMDNGRGDGGVQGRHRAETVLSTRRLLKTFVRDGSFPEPHGFETPDRIQTQLADVTFHVPRISVGPVEMMRKMAADLVRGRPVTFSRRRRYLADSEHVAILRKAG